MTKYNTTVGMDLGDKTNRYCVLKHEHGVSAAQWMVLVAATPRRVSPYYYPSCSRIFAKKFTLPVPQVA